MISLDEDYIGHADDAIIVHGLKVCGGIVARLSNNHLLGAHFTNTTHSAIILTGCTYLMEHWAAGGTVRELFWVWNQTDWEGRQDKYNNATVLLDELKTMFRFAGPLWVYDKNKIANSVDLKITSSAGLYYRKTPDPDPAEIRPTTDVKRVYVPSRTVINGRSQPLANMATPLVVDLSLPIFPHKVQTNDSGWSAFSQGQMVPV
jgi:hypothetical protein